MGEVALALLGVALIFLVLLVTGAAVSGWVDREG